MKAIAGIAALGILLGGCAYTVGDGWFFKPQPLPTKARPAGDLKWDREERLSATGSIITIANGYMPTLAARLPAKVTHEIVDVGSQKIAISRVKAANAIDGEPLIVACMGQSGTRFNSGEYYAEKLLPWGEVLLLDYPGYGDSSGKPTVDDMMLFQQNFPAYIDGISKGRPLVMWGHSLGGPICAALAGGSRQADAVVLETTGRTFTDIMAVGKPWFTPPFVKLELDDKLKTYDIVGSLAHFNGPVMVINGGKDQRLPGLTKPVADALKAQGLHVAYIDVPQADHMNAAMNSQFAKEAWPFFQALSDTRH
ncbi:MAG TPA: alpha/beta hydrolase family protein [Hyphomonadaceae bacterium]|nr:alpha/beta hydrolase family protein [Hyphomonadaceae bacterium]